MAETNSADIEMAEKSPDIRSEARDILISASHKGMASVIEQLMRIQESKEKQRMRALYDFCVSNFPGCLTLQILKVYRSSSICVLRSRSLHHLCETLGDFKNRSFNLSLGALCEIKPLLISCLRMQEAKESDFKLFRKIVSFVAYHVVILYNGKWDELSDCIFFLAKNEPSKAFHVFVDLPPVNKEFLDRVFEIIIHKADDVFLSREQTGVEDWILALETVVKMGIQLVNTKVTLEELKKFMEKQVPFVVKSAKALVKKGMEPSLVRGLEDFQRFLLRDVNQYNYTTEQCHFVLIFMKRIEGVGTLTKEILRRIKMLITKPGKPAIKPQERTEIDRRLYDRLKTLSPLGILTFYANTCLGDRFREVAIRRLNVLLSNHTSRKGTIAISDMKKLWPLLISCLYRKGVSDISFKFLGEVVNHVAREMFFHQREKTWSDLQIYIYSKIGTEFHRVVYIFQCLTTLPLNDKELNPMIGTLCPVISSRLNPPTELLVDNICWVLAFTGAFCLMFHMAENTSHIEEIAHKMVDSVRVLVERRMEVGLVRRAFRDLETIVKKQLIWYETSEYKFVKGLLWRLYAIQGMKWESKIVLWRINVIVERRMKTEFKKLPENETDWLHDNEEEEEEDEDEEDEEEEEEEDEEEDEDEEGE